MRKIKDNVIKFAVDEFSMDTYDSDEFAIGRICFLSTKPNSHGLVISDEVLRECAPSVLGKWLVAEYDELAQDVTTHTADEWIMGYFPREQEVEFIESDEGYLCAYANVVVSKIYASELCGLFDEDTSKPVSVEMQYADDDGNDVVQEFNIVGVTVLGKVLGQKVNGSCPDANMTMVRFSQDDADEFYSEHTHDTLSELKRFSEERRIQMAEKTYKINKTELKDTKWGDVDKTALRNTIMEAKNKATLVKAVYLLVENGWQDAPSEKLKYPVMELEGDTFYYNRGALSAALGYAKAEGEDSVVAKVEKLYKKFDLDDKEEKEDKADMSKEIEFAAVDLGDMWGRLCDALREKVGYNFYINGIYEEDNKKFVIVKQCDTGELAKFDFSYTEDGIELIGEAIGVDVEFVPNEKVVKFAVPEGFDEFIEMEESKDDDIDDDDDKEDKDDDVDDKDDDKAEMSEKEQELMAQLEEKENIIMGLENELKELKAYKDEKEALAKSEKVESVMAEAKEYLCDDMIKELADEAECCDGAKLSEWENKVKAACFAEIQKAKESDDILRMSIPTVEHKENKTVWDRL